MKITIFEVEEWERQTFDALAEQHQVEFVNQPLTPDNVHRWGDADIVSAFIYSKLNSDVLQQFDNLMSKSIRTVTERN